MWGRRYIVVPPRFNTDPFDVPLRRRKTPKRTPWHPRPDGEQITTRPGSREWFGDNVFVERRDGYLKSALGTSVSLHVACAVVLFILVLTRTDEVIARVRPSLVMPASLSLVQTLRPVASAIGSIGSSLGRPSAKPSAERTPPVAAAAGVPAPVEAPADVTPETGAESAIAGIEGGVAGGLAPGVLGGVVAEGTVDGGGIGAGSGNGTAPGPLRVGSPGVKPPRKIKDVRPAYPLAALQERAQGSVVVDIVIGADGKVHDARVLRSMPLFDQAAIDAVRQWEYEPSMLDGVRVAVILTVVVGFVIQ